MKLNLDDIKATCTTPDELAEFEKRRPFLEGAEVFEVGTLTRDASDAQCSFCGETHRCRWFISGTRPDVRICDTCRLVVGGADEDKS